MSICGLGSSELVNLKPRSIIYQHVKYQNLKYYRNGIYRQATIRVKVRTLHVDIFKDNPIVVYSQTNLQTYPYHFGNEGNHQLNQHSNRETIKNTISSCYRY